MITFCNVSKWLQKLYNFLNVSIFKFQSLFTIHLFFNPCYLNFFTQKDLMYKHKDFQVEWFGNALKTNSTSKTIYFQIQLVCVPSFIVKTSQEPL